MIPLGSEKLLVIPHLKQKQATETTFLARESIFGLLEIHTSFQIYRALLEGIAYNLRDGIEDVRGQFKRIILCGGGAGSQVFCRIISDVLELPVYVCRSGSGASGIALLTGIGTGLIPAFKTGENDWCSTDEVILPDKQNSKIYRKYFRLYLKIRRGIEDYYSSLDALPGKN